MSSIPSTSSSPGIFRGWFVVAAAFAVTFVGFGSAYTFSAFVESLQRCEEGAERISAAEADKGHGERRGDDEPAAENAGTG